MFCVIAAPEKFGRKSFRKTPNQVEAYRKKACGKAAKE